MSIKTNKIIQVDEKTRIEAPDIEIESFIVKPQEKSITINCIFTSGKTIVYREVGLLKYSTDWTIADIENFITDFLSAKEVKDTTEPIKTK